MINREKLREKPSIWLVIIMVLVSAYALMPVGAHFLSTLNADSHEFNELIFTVGYPGTLTGFVIGILASIGFELIPLSFQYETVFSILHTSILVSAAAILFFGTLIGWRSYYHLTLCCFVILIMTAGTTALLYYIHKYF